MSRSAAARSSSSRTPPPPPQNLRAEERLRNLLAQQAAAQALAEQQAAILQRKAEEDLERLWQIYKRTGDDNLRNSLIEHHMPLVRAIAERLLQTLPKSIELDDLTSAGTDAEVDRFLEVYGPLADLMTWVRGNHESYHGLQRGAVPVQEVVLPGAHLVVLDTSVEGSESGHVTAARDISACAYSWKTTRRGCSAPPLFRLNAMKCSSSAR